MSHERPSENPTALDFVHAGERYSIPRASSAAELWPLLHERILPGLEKIKIDKADQLSNLEIGLCLAWFVQEGEGLHEKNPEAARAIEEALKNTGIRVPDIPYKARRFCTSRNSFLHRMKENPDSYIGFDDKTYVLAPAYALAYTEDNWQDQLDRPDKYGIELSLNNGVAIRPADLMEGKTLRDPKRERLYYLSF
ncbi:MAG: hypothetical protein WC768_04150 [Patescibacteria group bacterium]|jgi:hypothetical protein